MGIIKNVSWIITALIIFIIAAIFFVFENKRVSAEKIVLIAMLSAVSSAGRVLFAAIPSAQPSSFIIIMTGIVFGAESGFMTGAATALLSGLVMGLGPWTPYQMGAWGIMGFSAGLLRRPLSKNKPFRIIFGALWGVLFGWIMNLWMLISMDLFGGGITQVIAVYAASLFFDGIHAATNALFIFFGGDAFIKTLSRIAVKYGLSKQA
jgi:energy-coupling factor transport system substrate-specific component